MGGEITDWVAALDTRIAVAVAAGSPSDLAVMSLHGNHPCWMWQRGDAREYYDPGDLNALVASRILVRESGKQDTIYSDESPPFGTAKEVVWRARPAFQALGGQLIHYLHFNAHAFQVGQFCTAQGAADGVTVPTNPGAESQRSLVRRVEQRRHDDCHDAFDLLDNSGELPIAFGGGCRPSVRVRAHAALCGLVGLAVQAGCSPPPPRIAGRPPTTSDGGAPDGAERPVAWLWSVRCRDGHDPVNPLDYGRCAVEQASAEAHAEQAVTVTTVDDPAAASVEPTLAPLLDQRPESYVIAPVDGTTWIVGRDAVGAMYGALQIAERLRIDGATALPPAGSIRGAPALSFRGANLFWVLPEMGETAWWFLDEGFWRDYLDLLAHARLNVLDLHGMYDLANTTFPNALLYLARSTSFPNVGAPGADRDRNVKMLNRVVAMAHARGVRVGLMTYSATSEMGGSAGTLDDADLQTYVREAAADVAARIPGLSMMGFRTGESGRPARWYADTFVAGVRQVAPAMTLATRTWGSSKAEVLSLATSIGPNMVVEAKFNGEHLGPPYAIAGGAMAGWSSYSYQDYLNPPHPWTFVFQVRAGGSHQIFREASYLRTQRAVASMGFSPTVAGFTLEPPTAYTPQRDFYHASARDQFSPWAFARDDLMYLEWGRLGYDPTEPEAHFRQILAREAGTDALWPAVQAASDIVPWITTGRTCGPDSRNFEPEMELGGDVGQWAGVAGGPDAVPSCDGATPFDTFAVASPDETAADLVAGVPTSRLTPVDVASLVLSDADVAAQASTAATAGALARDVARECFGAGRFGPLLRSQAPGRDRARRLRALGVRRLDGFGAHRH